MTASTSLGSGCSPGVVNEAELEETIYCIVCEPIVEGSLGSRWIGYGEQVLRQRIPFSSVHEPRKSFIVCRAVTLVAHGGLLRSVYQKPHAALFVLNVAVWIFRLVDG